MERTLVEVGGILDAVGVPFFLVLGTCLGVVRGGRIIGWDKDIDIGVLVEHLTPVIPTLMERFEAAGFVTKAHSSPLRFDRAIRLVRGPDRVDIAGFMRHAEERYSPSSRKSYAIVYPAGIIENTEPVTYLGREWRVPSPSEEYLRRHYGPFWKEPDRRWKPSSGRARVEDYYRMVTE